jgi:hypothetical protein
MKACFSLRKAPEGTITLQAAILASSRRFFIHDHRTSAMLVCRHVPITTLTPDGLLDSNVAPPVALTSGARFTVLAFVQGNVVAGTTYEYDGQTIIERSSIDQQIQVHTVLMSSSPRPDASPDNQAATGEATRTC